MVDGKEKCEKRNRLSELIFHRSFPTSSISGTIGGGIKDICKHYLSIITSKPESKDRAKCRTDIRTTPDE